MENKDSIWPIVFLVLAMVAVVAITGVIGYNLHPATITIEKPVDKIVTNTVYVDRNVTQIVNVDTNKALLDKAILEFTKEIEDEDSLQMCSGDQYDTDQIAVSKIYDGSTVSVDSDRNGDITTVNFEIRLKYSDKDVQEKCYETFNVEAVFEDGEDTTLDY
jgi:hypothetical protein